MSDERSASLVALAASPRTPARATVAVVGPLGQEPLALPIESLAMARLLLGRALVAHLEEARVARGRLPQQVLVERHGQR